MKIGLREGPLPPKRPRAENLVNLSVGEKEKLNEYLGRVFAELKKYREDERVKSMRNEVVSKIPKGTWMQELYEGVASNLPFTIDETLSDDDAARIGRLFAFADLIIERYPEAFRPTE